MFAFAMKMPWTMAEPEHVEEVVGHFDRSRRRAAQRNASMMDLIHLKLQDILNPSSSSDHCRLFFSVES